MTEERAAPASVEALRTEIDDIDGEIHRLIRRRAEVVEGLATVKKTGGAGPGGQAFRPGREAQVLRRLAAAHEGAFPVVALLGLWRTMMAAFLRMQQPVEVRVAAPDFALWDLARAHFGAATPIEAVGASNDALAAVRASGQVIAVMPPPADSDPWWRHMHEGGAMVLARLPFFAKSSENHARAFVVALALPEASGDDVTWLRFDGPRATINATIGEAARAAGLELSPVAAYNPSEPLVPASRLMAVGRYLDADDPALARLKAAMAEGSAEVERVGCFARPIVLPGEA